jgi:hypothetical protein
MELYRSLEHKDGADARVRRELAVTLSKRGDILIMDGRPASALDTFRHALAILKPMADADAQNALFRQDVTGAWSEIGRALVMYTKYIDGLAMLDRAIRAYEQSASAARSLNEIAFVLGTTSFGMEKHCWERAGPARHSRILKGPAPGSYQSRKIPIVPGLRSLVPIPSRLACL